MTEWEYRIEPQLPEGLAQAEDVLNAMGEVGWELVAIREDGWLIYKRPVGRKVERSTVD